MQEIISFDIIPISTFDVLCNFFLDNLFSVFKSAICKNVFQTNFKTLFLHIDNNYLSYKIACKCSNLNEISISRLYNKRFYSFLYTGTYNVHVCH